MYPRLHVTGFATHKQQDEYPQPVLDLRPGDVETFTLSYFPLTTSTTSGVVSWSWHDSPRSSIRGSGRLGRSRP